MYNYLFFFKKVNFNIIDLTNKGVPPMCFSSKCGVILQNSKKFFKLLNKFKKYHILCIIGFISFIDKMINDNDDEYLVMIFHGLEHKYNIYIL